uniref:Uncharacterized protein n=1 Tax=Rhizophora mucronata TaxID=61149 RepID=A0A2P2NEE3_RHIMU
MLNFILSL